MNRDPMFDEQYRVIAIDDRSLTLRGIHSGELLTINASPEIPFRSEEFAVGKLIALSDPSSGLIH
jgi:hypothetical protein